VGVARGDAGGTEPVAEGKYEVGIGCVDDADGKGDCSEPGTNIDGDGMATCKFGCGFVGGGLTGGSDA